MNIIGKPLKKEDEDELESFEELDVNAKQNSKKENSKKTITTQSSEAPPQKEIPKELSTNETDSLNFLVHQYFTRNEFDSCLEVLSRYSKSNTGYEAPYSLLIKGLIKRAGGGLSESLTLFKQTYSLLKGINDTSYIFKEIAKTFLLTGKFSSAIDMYSSVLEKNPEDWDCLYHLGLCNMNIKKFKEAENYLNKALEIYHCEEILIAFGKVLLKENKLNPAIEKFEDALTFSPNNANLKSTLGTLYMKRNDIEKAMDFFNESMNIEKKYSNSLIGLAAIHQYHQKFEDALALYKITFVNNNESALVWNNLGLCFFAKNKKIAAATCLNRALYLAPFEWYISFNLALVYLASDQYMSAFVHMNAASNFKKDNYLIYMYLGVILAELNDFGNASNYFNKSLSLRQDQITLFNYIVCFIKNGMMSNAKEKFEQFIKIYRKNDSEEGQLIESQLPNIKKLLS